MLTPEERAREVAARIRIGLAEGKDDDLGPAWLERYLAQEFATAEAHTARSVRAACIRVLKPTG